MKSFIFILVNLLCYQTYTMDQILLNENLQERQPLLSKTNHISIDITKLERKRLIDLLPSDIWSLIVDHLPINSIAWRFLYLYFPLNRTQIISIVKKLEHKLLRDCDTVENYESCVKKIKLFPYQILRHSWPTRGKIKDNHEKIQKLLLSILYCPGMQRAIKFAQLKQLRQLRLAWETNGLRKQCSDIPFDYPITEEFRSLNVDRSLLSPWPLSITITPEFKEYVTNLIETKEISKLKNMELYIKKMTLQSLRYHKQAKFMYAITHVLIQAFLFGSLPSLISIYIAQKYLHQTNVFLAIFSDIFFFLSSCGFFYFFSVGIKKTICNRKNYRIIHENSPTIIDEIQNNINALILFKDIVKKGINECENALT